MVDLGFCKHCPPIADWRHKPIGARRCRWCGFVELVQFCLGWWTVRASARLMPFNIMYRGEVIPGTTLLVWWCGYVKRHVHSPPQLVEGSHNEVAVTHGWYWPWMLRIKRVGPRAA